MMTRTPLFVCVVAVHAAGLLLLAQPLPRLADAPPILLEMTAFQAPAEKLAPQQAQVIPQRKAQAQLPQRIAAAAAEPVAPQAVPAVGEMALPDHKQQAQPEAPAVVAVKSAGPVQAPVAAPATVHEVAPSFHADYLRNPEPTYPRQSYALGEEGRVLLRVTVSEQGTPVRVEVIKSSGYARLDEAARSTVEGRWRFAPARRGDMPVAGVVQVPVSFAIRG